MRPASLCATSLSNMAGIRRSSRCFPTSSRSRRLRSASAENAPLLYFGRLSPEKGVDDLLHAMQRLPNLRLIIAGDGPERGRLEQLAADLGLANVEFAGHMRGAELDRAIANSRFTVLPSHAYETLGKTILESYARRREPWWRRTWDRGGNWCRRARRGFCTGREMWSSWHRRSSFSAHNRNWRTRWDGRARSRCGKGTRRRRTTKRWLVCMSVWLTERGNRQARPKHGRLEVQSLVSDVAR